MIDPGGFYRDPDEVLCQGDILAAAPSIVLRQAPIKVLRTRMFRGGVEAFEPFPYVVGAAQTANSPNGGFALDSVQGDLITSHCNLTFGIVISHGCEIDKPHSDSLQVGLIRRLPAEMSDNNKDAVRGGRNLRYFYLPEYNEFPEGYVDLSRISTIHTQYVDKSSRIASLTDTAVQELQLALVRFLTRRSPTRKNWESIENDG